MFPGRHHYASVFHEAEFMSLPKHLETGSELRNLLEVAIEKIPLAGHYWSKVGLLRLRDGQATFRIALGPIADNLTFLKNGKSEGMSELVDARQQEPEEAGFTEIICLIGASRERAMQAVNTALINLYWQIGETISRRVAAAQMGRGRAEPFSSSE